MLFITITKVFFPESPQPIDVARLRMIDECSGHLDHDTELTSCEGSNNPDSPDTFNDGGEITDLTAHTGTMILEQLEKSDSFAFSEPQYLRDSVINNEPHSRRIRRKHRRKRPGLIVTRDGECDKMYLEDGGTAPPTPEDDNGKKWNECMMLA